MTAPQNIYLKLELTLEELDITSTTTQIDADTGEKFIYAENVGQALTLKAQFDAIVNAGGTVKIQTKMLTLSDALEGQSLDEDGQPSLPTHFLLKLKRLDSVIKFYIQYSL